MPLFLVPTHNTTATLLTYNPIVIMRHDHLKRELELIILLTQNRRYTVEELCQLTDISSRSFYYFINFFKEAGFKVEKHGRYYSLDRESKFFQQIADLLHFTEDEAMLMRQLIDNAGMETPRLRSLRQKLDRFYDFKILENEDLQRRVAEMRTTLYEAIKQQKQVWLMDYSSPSSHTMRNRTVEPFRFLNNNRDVMCYEESSHRNKTFRLSRMGSVQMLDKGWEHESKHKVPLTDVFGFGGDELTPLVLILGQLSHNVMIEEYPKTVDRFTQLPDGRWRLEVEVCSFLGIGRFVLGLLDDVEIIGNSEFCEYISGKLSAWNARFNK